MDRNFEELGSWGRLEKTPRWSSQRHFSRRNVFLIVSTGIIIIILTVALLSSRILHSFDRELHRLCSVHEHTRPYEVTQHREYYDMTPAGDPVWDSLFTENQGYVFRQYRPYGASEDAVRMYGISMFHQLHCLQIIRAMIQSMKYNDTNTGVEQLHDHHHHDLNDDHWMHCFDYLRQTILCNADDTLEAPMKNPHTGGDVIDGHGPRTCKDSSKLYEWSSASGPSLGVRRQMAREGREWPETEPEGIQWPDPLPWSVTSS